jgi:hypothetical protein
MKPTCKTNATRTLIQQLLKLNEGIPSRINATVGFRVCPLGYVYFLC